MSKTNPQVDGYLRKNPKWQSVLQQLRTILLNSPLTEEVKWHHPCYTFQDGNVVILGAFKEYCALTFVKGALLKDPKGVLKKPGENTQAVRVIHVSGVQEIAEIKPAIKALIDQAIEVEKSGLKVKLKKITEHKVPAELEKKLKAVPGLRTAFRGLTPGRQRAYLLFFSGAKQSKTRELRVEKCMAGILKGKGLDD